MSLLRFVLSVLGVAMYCVLNAQTLKFGSDRKFKIVQFTDVHWVSGSEHSVVSDKCMNRVLDEEKPDLVVFSGDFVTGKPAAKGLEEVLQPTVSRGIPFAMTFGNHDDEQGLSREELFELIRKYKGNLTETTPGISGVTNYTLTLKSHDGDKDAAVLYIFDSNSYSPLKSLDSYDWIKRDQINWYADRSKAFKAANGGSSLPSLAFFHIPLPEYNEAARDEEAKLIGTRREKACAPVVNSGLFTAMLECGDVMGVFVGHDHVNDYAVEWKGVMLCYGRFTGSKNTYSDIPGGNGARVIEMEEGRRGFRSWIRMNDGKTINEFSFPDDYLKD